MAEIARLREAVEALSKRLGEKDARIAELERLLSESRRSGKRQAAPFSKGDPKEEPARPGRRSGEAHGRHGHRMVPTGPIDRVLDALLPSCCPNCGGELELCSTAEQFQVDLAPVAPVTTRYNVPIARCVNCKRRVQGRHLEQTSDALGAASSQVGPVAKSWAAWLHYGLGLSFVKSSALLARLGVSLSPGALSQAAGVTSSDLVPVQAAIVAKLNEAEMIVPDETGWKVCGEGAWLWAATTRAETAYSSPTGVATSRPAK